MRMRAGGGIKGFGVWLGFAAWLAATAGIVTAEHTRRWRQSTYDEFLKGTTRGIAVRSDGRLELAPKFTQLADADASYLWSVKLDSKGTPYASGGSPAKVFKLDASGKTATVFQSSELSAQAIAFDSKGTLYVGTSPDGKVYRVSPTGEKSVFFDPKTKYIWDLEFGSDGTLYVATGDKGQIFAVAPDGKSQLFYASDEAHIRVLAFDGKGNLIAGTEPSGRVLRLTRADGSARKNEKDPTTEGFVLFETPKREVTSLAVAPDGVIYVAAIGERPHTAAVISNIPPGAPGQATTTVTTSGNVTVIAPVQGTGQPQTPYIPFPTVISSGVYKIAPDGAPEELWTSRDDVVYSLGLGNDGRLLAGLGNTGSLLAIDGRGVFAQLAKAGSAQITAIVRNSAGKVILCTANPGKLISLGPEYEPEGTYESRSFDAQLFSQWGRLEWWSPPAASDAKAQNNSREPRLEFYVRSGNTEDPGKEWSKWYGPYTASGTETGVPSSRFAQWKAVIHDGRPGDGIEWVALAYQPKNVAPVIDGIQIQEPGVRVQGQPALATGAAPTATLKFPPAAASSSGGIVMSQSTSPAKFEAPPQAILQKGYHSVLWNAHDENDDDLKYAVYFRGEDEKEWKLLKDNLEQRFYSFDTTTLADGAYYLKIVAIDLASNPPDKALKAERESERFEVDNSPPVVGKIDAGVSNRSAQVKFSATDATSSIERAQFSLDGGEWTLVAPKSGISDGKQQAYEFMLHDLKPGEHTIAVRAYDRFDNVGTGKAALSITAK
jgi:outer membrane protein assembly factor BamB